MKLTRRQALAFAVCTGAALAGGTAAAQSYPTKSVTIVNGYPAGGDTDAMARLYAEKLGARLGQQVLVENQPGASGTIAASHVAKASADGYTLLFVPSTFAIAQHVLKVGPTAAHDVTRDFTPIIKTGNIPLLAVTAPSIGVQDMTQLIAQAKAGKALTYGSPGTGSPMHIVGEMLNRAAGTKITHVPYRGVAPVITDALGGHVSVGWVTPAAAAQHVQAGKLIPLAVAERQRSKLMPEVPTLSELGYAVDVSAWMGLLGPKGVPADIVQTLNRHMNEILKMPDVVAKMTALGIEPVGGEPSILSRQVADDNARFGKLVKEFGITAQ